MQYSIPPVDTIPTKFILSPDAIEMLDQSLITGHVPTNPFPDACPGPNPTLTQTLDLTQGRVGTGPATEQGPYN